MKKTFWIAISVLLFMLACFFAGILVAERDPIGWMEARTESEKVIRVVKEMGIYNRKYPYTEAVYYTRKHSNLYNIDRKLIYAIAIQESQFNPYAKNINYTAYGKTEDRGLLQVNTIWNGVIMSDAVLSVMFDDNKNKYQRVEDFIYEVEHNIFIGCFIMRQKMMGNKTIRAAITRYNGAGYYAELYADKVLDIYYRISKEF